jgi:hypothetical protein
LPVGVALDPLDFRFKRERTLADRAHTGHPLPAARLSMAASH